ncbi:uncharacterized protein MONOS_10050 [Monocercomonoides exilis]|uniref:uncharacterized protein n=1 Tax=Monocercomonoides exilis TaxID=2049356 RepID=UPI003559F38F|nr:hypothetical protein MONOS_10050 [Monocercomonoides exilis]|eukprot:MONOS_10050.1-p1 / transcript=MONOS_10050.1 / gene=MONOS_10050 / organism=Monocercomonoides_exilis_PA203 / gene_product=unspecified product / transcript_product=unspecified product / location=Mono_scaffold00440:19227-22417(+) / protein_length=705 / sequence_SO=supercontig / SO=protein_coding / is_pseudo=false
MGQCIQKVSSINVQRDITFLSANSDAVIVKNNVVESTQNIGNSILINRVFDSGIWRCDVKYHSSPFGRKVGIVDASFSIPPNYEIGQDDKSAAFLSVFGPVQYNGKAIVGNSSWDNEDIVSIVLNLNRKPNFCHFFVNGIPQPCFVVNIPQKVRIGFHLTEPGGRIEVVALTLLRRWPVSLKQNDPHLAWIAQRSSLAMRTNQKLKEKEMSDEDEQLYHNSDNAVSVDETNKSRSLASSAEDSKSEIGEESKSLLEACDNSSENELSNSSKMIDDASLSQEGTENGALLSLSPLERLRKRKRESDGSSALSRSGWRVADNDDEEEMKIQSLEEEKRKMKEKQEMEEKERERKLEEAEITYRSVAYRTDSSPSLKTIEPLSLLIDSSSSSPIESDISSLPVSLSSSSSPVASPSSSSSSGSTSVPSPTISPSNDESLLLPKKSETFSVLEDVHSISVTSNVDPSYFVVRNENPSDPFSSTCFVFSPRTASASSASPSFASTSSSSQPYSSSSASSTSMPNPHSPNSAIPQSTSDTSSLPSLLSITLSPTCPSHATFVLSPFLTHSVWIAAFSFHNTSKNARVGIADESERKAASFPGDDVHSAAYRSDTGSLVHNKKFKEGNSKWADGSLVVVQVDLDSSPKTCHFFCDGIQQPISLKEIPVPIRFVVSLPPNASVTIHAIQRLSASASVSLPNSRVLSFVNKRT